MTKVNTTHGGIFAAAYDPLMWPFERVAIGAWRRRLAARAITLSTSPFLKKNDIEKCIKIMHTVCGD